LICVILPHPVPEVRPKLVPPVNRARPLFPIRIVREPLSLRVARTLPSRSVTTFTPFDTNSLLPKYTFSPTTQQFGTGFCHE